MHATAVWAASLSLACLATAEPGTLSFPIYKDKRAEQQLRQRSLNRRADNLAVTIDNSIQLYFVNISVGTPAQDVQVQLDTGSSDLWMNAPDACGSQAVQPCVGGTYDVTLSKTSEVTGKGEFQISYADNSGVIGDYITDDLTVGGATLKDQTMAIAHEVTGNAPNGIIGVGFDINESQVSASNGTVKPYQNFIDSLLASGIINTRSYSLYLDSLDDSTGTILFGGYDTEKFAGNLSILAIQKDAESGAFDSMDVILNSIGVQDKDNSKVLTTGSLPIIATLDSGSSATLVPADVFYELAEYFGAVNNSQYGYVVPCDMNGLDGALEYQFGGPTGPVIAVPYSELNFPITDDKGAAVTDPDTKKAICSLGLDIAIPGVPTLLFGDTFLRSAYVVYDLDNLQIGIAQTVFNSTKSNIVSITTGSNGTLPGDVISAVSLPAGATAPPATGPTATGSVGSGNLLAGTTTAYPSAPTGTAGGASGTSSSKAAAPTKESEKAAIALAIIVAAAVIEVL